MKSIIPEILEQGRIRTGRMASNAHYGLMGALVVRGPGRFPHKLQIISSGPNSPTGWEHVSACVRNKNLTPTWEEMDFVKRLFWRDGETVMQLHVPRVDHVNNKANVLHLWRPIHEEIPRPDSLLVGIQGTSPDDVKQALRAAR